MKRNGGKKKPKVSAIRGRQLALSVQAGEEGISLPQRELLAFISAVSDLIGPETSRLEVRAHGPQSTWLDPSRIRDILLVRAQAQQHAPHSIWHRWQEIRHGLLVTRADSFATISSGRPFRR